MEFGLNQPAPQSLRERLDEEIGLLDLQCKFSKVLHALESNQLQSAEFWYRNWKFSVDRIIESIPGNYVYHEKKWYIL